MWQGVCILQGRLLRMGDRFWSYENAAVFIKNRSQVFGVGFLFLQRQSSIACRASFPSDIVSMVRDWFLEISVFLLLSEKIPK